MCVYIIYICIYILYIYVYIYIYITTIYITVYNTIFRYTVYMYYSVYSIYIYIHTNTYIQRDQNLRSCDPQMDWSLGARAIAATRGLRRHPGIGGNDVFARGPLRCGEHWLVDGRGIGIHPNSTVGFDKFNK